MDDTARAQLSDQQRLDWLRLIRSENIGPVRFRRLINHFGSAGNALECLPDMVRRAGGQTPRLCPIHEAEQEIAALSAIGARLVAIGEEAFPTLLRVVEGAPPLLTVWGAPEIFQKPMLAVVGARDASAAGRKMTEVLCNGLGQHGIAIVSGLARGIDTSAHRAALETGTIAVQAGGLGQIYPAENIPLARKIVENGGAIVSEMPFTLEARARDFPRRNRLVSGMSLGTLVVEAALRSGSLHTAKFATEQGREVMAVPGSPLDPRAEGTNQLLKQGAGFIIGVDDVLEILRASTLVAYRPDIFAEDHPPFSHNPDRSAPEMVIDDHDRQSVLEALGPVPTPINDIARLTGQSQRLISAVLLELDLLGKLEHHSNGTVSLRF